MRGPTSEDRKASAPAMQAQGRNMGYHQQANSESANYNGNNRSSLGWGAGQEFVNGDAPHHHMHPNAEPVPSPHDDSNPFAEYAWMVDADEFDKQMMEQMEQEEYLETCFEQMWQEEEENDDGWFIPPQEASAANTIQTESLEKLTINETVQPTMLNPNAAEFVPRRAIVNN